MIEPFLSLNYPKSRALHPKVPRPSLQQWKLRSWKGFPTPSRCRIWWMVSERGHTIPIADFLRSCSSSSSHLVCFHGCHCRRKSACAMKNPWSIQNPYCHIIILIKHWLSVYFTNVLGLPSCGLLVSTGVKSDLGTHHRHPGSRHAAGCQACCRGSALVLCESEDFAHPDHPLKRHRPLESAVFRANGRE